MSTQESARCGLRKSANAAVSFGQVQRVRAPQPHASNGLVPDQQLPLESTEPKSKVNLSRQLKKDPATTLLKGCENHSTGQWFQTLAAALTRMPDFLLLFADDVTQVVAVGLPSETVRLGGGMPKE